MSMGHGASGLLVGYGLAVVGLAAGLIAVRGPGRRWLVVPLVAAPLAAASALLWSLVLGATPRLVALLGPRLTAIGGGALILAVGVLGGILTRRQSAGARVERGTRVVDPPWPADRTFGPRATLIHCAGQVVPAADETKHFKLVGTTGTGKSTAIRGLLRGALVRGDRAVIADPDGAYTAAFFDPGRGDVILNPFDARSMRWDLFGELRKSYDGDLLARALIPDHGGEDRAWRAYARTFLGACLRQLAIARTEAKKRELSSLRYGPAAVAPSSSRSSSIGAVVTR